MFEGLGTDLRSYERRSVFTFMILYLGGIMLFGSVILWWYGYNQNRRIHKEEKIALKLYDLQCKRVLKNAPEGFSCPIEKPDFKNSYESISKSENGDYILIDYLNFKGLGDNEKERYNSKGWGLIQVLECMPNISNPKDEFRECAKTVLKIRVDNSPKAKNEKRWLKGWYNRIDTYK